MAAKAMHAYARTTTGAAGLEATSVSFPRDSSSRLLRLVALVVIAACSSRAKPSCSGASRRAETLVSRDASERSVRVLIQPADSPTFKLRLTRAITAETGSTKTSWPSDTTLSVEEWAREGRRGRSPTTLTRA